MRFIRYAIEGAIGFALTIIFTVGFLFAPLDIASTVVERSPLVRGDTGHLIHTVHKPWWAVAFCTATSGQVHIFDAAGTPYNQAARFGYNDGSLRNIRTPFEVPSSAEIGPATIYESATYSCVLGLIPRAVYSPIANFSIDPSKRLQFQRGAPEDG